MWCRARSRCSRPRPRKACTISAPRRWWARLRRVHCCSCTAPPTRSRRSSSRSGCSSMPASRPSCICSPIRITLCLRGATPAFAASCRTGSRNISRSTPPRRPDDRAPMPTFTPQQDAALSAVADWLKAKPGQTGTPPLFRLFGYAGTGKTTLARHLAEDVDGKVLYAAFTGKAALVMRRKGCEGASTIHSMIYKPIERETETPTFELWDDAPIASARLIVIDECSMVDAELGRDLMSFGVPVLVLGDPAQLPPIQGGGFFTEAEPNVMLTEVHRQARDNPIIRLSMHVRAGEQLAI